MTKPNVDDHKAIAGTHPGATSQDEMASKISLKIDTTKPLREASNQIINAADWNLNSMSDTNSSPKYATDPTVSYYGSGSLSLKPSEGKLTFSAKANEPSRGAFSLDQSASNLYSNLVNTTLGSLKIDTIDGQELNPLSPTLPSTNFSPTKPWIKKLFPTLSDRNLMTIAILALIQQGLKGVDSSKNSDRKQSDIDMATIIIDNQIIEDQIFSNL